MDVQFTAEFSYTFFIGSECAHCLGTEERECNTWGLHHLHLKILTRVTIPPKLKSVSGLRGCLHVKTRTGASFVPV